jgi:putative ABC transport system substrate-binding protein
LRLGGDVIVVSTTPAAQAAMAATRTVPIIMIGLGDPVRTGLVNSLVEPGGNVTGLSLMVPEMGAKRLGLLKEAIPEITRILVLTYFADPIAAVQVQALQEAARSRGVTLQVRDIRSGDDLPAAFEAAAAENAQALLTTAESIFVAQRTRVTELAARYKIPAMYCYSRHVIDAGGLMAYEASYSDVIRRAASYVDRVLKGATASDLPVGLPTEFEFTINLKTARTLGLTIPPAVLALTDKVVE